MVRGERRVETLTTAKTANTPTHMRLRTEHPRERLRTDSLVKRLSQASDAGQNGKVVSIGSNPADVDELFHSTLESQITRVHQINYALYFG